MFDVRCSPPLVRIFQILNVIGFLIFVLFSWLQHEDDNPDIYVQASLPDMIEWIVFYALVALLFLLAFFRKFPWPLYVLTVLFCFYELIATGGSFFANLTSEEFDMTKQGMSPVRPQVEETREFFGALIALTAIGFLWWQRRYLWKHRPVLLADEGQRASGV